VLEVLPQHAAIPRKKVRLSGTVVVGKAEEDRWIAVRGTQLGERAAMDENLIEHLPDGVLLVENGAIRFASGRAAEVLGVSVRRLTDMPLRDLLPAPALEVVERVLKGAISCTVRDLPWDRPSAARRISVTGTPGPGTGQVVVVVVDATDPVGHTAAEGFRRRLAWLDSLAAGMAHEIRNPLGGIRGAAQLLRRDPEPDDHDELTLLIIQEADRINALVEQLMGLTRPRPVRRAAVSLNALVHDEVALLRARFGGDPVRWELDLDPSLPDVEGDPARLREAVGNLLRNAQEAASGAVAVRTRIDAGGHLTGDGFDRGVTLRLEVTDDGPGIEPSAAARLFDPFMTTKREGSGLGLFVTRLAIEDHRGLIHVDPRPGLGARFTIVLSQYLPPSPEASPEASPELSPDTPPNPRLEPLA
jgi:two-component system nitrogen regulation sensor histidine kinase GlnL